jgi:hypothetical protein
MSERLVRRGWRDLNPSDRMKICVFAAFWVASAATLWADNHFGWNIFPDRVGYTQISSLQQSVATVGSGQNSSAS